MSSEDEEDVELGVCLSFNRDYDKRFVREQRFVASRSVGISRSAHIAETLDQSRCSRIAVLEIFERPIVEPQLTYGDLY